MAIFGTVLVPIIAVNYSYSRLSGIESGVGFLTLLAVAALLEAYRRRIDLWRNAGESTLAVTVGIALGLLWVIEISINNFIAPPLPARDIIDNIFWAVIGLSILFFAVQRTLQKDSIVCGIEAGAWSGFASGLLACCMALCIIVLGMYFITHDPLNIAEWGLRGSGSQSLSMAAYFAYETFAGGFMHLIILGIGMGGILGVIGGCLGKGIKLAMRQFQPGI